MRPTTIAVAIDNVDNIIGLVRCKDEKSKAFISLKPLLTAVKFFNLEAVQGSVDAEGYESMPGMDRDSIYHTGDSLRKQGVAEVSKDPSPGP
jgi:hypothetical protein